MKYRTSVLLALASFATYAQQPPAGTSLTLKQVAQQAVLNSPEVTSKWHAYRAADEALGVARGGYFPRVDLTAGSGRESLKQPPVSTRNDYTRTLLSATLRRRGPQVSR